MLHFDKENDLDGKGGAELVMTLPEWVTVTQGFEQVKVLRLSKRGAVRWYASCCNSPMLNIHPSRNFPYGSVVVRGLDDPDALGPIAMRAFPDQAYSNVRASRIAFYWVTMRAFARAALARFRAAHKQTQYFTSEGQFTKTPERLDDARRTQILGLDAKDR